MKIDELAKRIVNYLIVEELEIKFDKIIDDSRLYPKEGLIVINEKVLFIINCIYWFLFSNSQNRNETC